MPLDTSDFPPDVQVAFFIFGLLEDNWDTMSGTYLGKKWGSIEYFFNLYEVQEPKTVLQFMKIYEHIIVEYKHQKAEEKRKAEKRKSAGGGRNYTHNVQG